MILNFVTKDRLVLSKRRTKREVRKQKLAITKGRATQRCSNMDFVALDYNKSASPGGTAKHFFTRKSAKFLTEAKPLYKDIGFGHFLGGGVRD